MNANALSTQIDITTQEGFQKIYLQYFSKLIRFAKYYTLSVEDAENIVQDVFVQLWERRDLVVVSQSLLAYLFTLVKNKCLDYLRHRSVIEEHRKDVEDAYYFESKYKLQSLEEFDTLILTNSDVETMINSALASLPERCREIFMKSRFDGKKHREIAQELLISEKTVENQIGIAMKKLTLKLQNSQPLLLFLL